MCCASPTGPGLRSPPWTPGTPIDHLVRTGRVVRLSPSFASPSASALQRFKRGLQLCCVVRQGGSSRSAAPTHGGPGPRAWTLRRRPRGLGRITERPRTLCTCCCVEVFGACTNCGAQASHQSRSREQLLNQYQLYAAWHARQTRRDQRRAPAAAARQS